MVGDDMEIPVIKETGDKILVSQLVLESNGVKTRAGFSALIDCWNESGGQSRQWELASQEDLSHLVTVALSSEARFCDQLEDIAGPVSKLDLDVDVTRWQNHFGRNCCATDLRKGMQRSPRLLQ